MKKYQHYIPVIILKHHADKHGKIWVYDKYGKCKLVRRNITKVCGENYTYEFHTKSNNIDRNNQNYIEDILSGFEGKFGKLDGVAGLIERIENREELSDRDIALCKEMVMLQMLRTPSMLDFMTYLFKYYNNKYIGKKRGDNLYYNLARFASVPRSQKDGLFEYGLKQIQNRPLLIWCTDQQFIVNDQNPVLRLKFPNKVRDCLMILPITYNRAIIITYEASKAKSGTYLDINTQWTNFINWKMYGLGDDSRFIYSRYYPDIKGLIDKIVFKKSIKT